MCVCLMCVQVYISSSHALGFGLSKKDDSKKKESKDKKTAKANKAKPKGHFSHVITLRVCVYMCVCVAQSQTQQKQTQVDNSDLTVNVNLGDKFTGGQLVMCSHNAWLDAKVFTRVCLFACVSVSFVCFHTWLQQRSGTYEGLPLHFDTAGVVYGMCCVSCLSFAYLFFCVCFLLFIGSEN